jgi:hypothetical protein
MEQTSTNDPVIEFRNVAYALPGGQQLLSELNLQVLLSCWDEAVREKPRR